MMYAGVENGLPRTTAGKRGGDCYYVHLCDGQVDVVEDVTAVHVNETSITFVRAHGAPLAYARGRVYYTCCAQDAPPAEF